MKSIMYKQNATDQMRNDIQSDIELMKTRSLILVGYVSLTEPPSNINAREGEYWLEGDTLNLIFPWQVHVYDGTAWSATTIEYTPVYFDVMTILGDTTSVSYYLSSTDWTPISPENISFNPTEFTTGGDGTTTINHIATSKVTGLDTTLSQLQTSTTNKADRVASAVSGNLAGLDINGNLTDSGRKPADFQGVISANATSQSQIIVQNPNTGVGTIAKLPASTFMLREATPVTSTQFTSVLTLYQTLGAGLYNIMGTSNYTDIPPEWVGAVGCLLFIVEYKSTSGTVYAVFELTMVGAPNFTQALFYRYIYSQEVALDMTKWKKFESADALQAHKDSDIVRWQQLIDAQHALEQKVSQSLDNKVLQGTPVEMPSPYTVTNALGVEVCTTTGLLGGGSITIGSNTYNGGLQLLGGVKEYYQVPNGTVITHSGFASVTVDEYVAGT